MGSSKPDTTHLAARTFARLQLAAAVGLDPFERDMFAGLIAQALAEVIRSGGTLAARLGLASDALARLLDSHFPETGFAAGMNETPARDVDAAEADLALLLRLHRADAAPSGDWLACIIARRAQLPNHLWQDLGLADRAQLGHLMQRYFPRLAARNPGMRWKKFFARQLCNDPGHSICPAPVCDACDEIAACFAPEAGSSLVHVDATPA